MQKVHRCCNRWLLAWSRVGTDATIFLRVPSALAHDYGRVLIREPRGTGSAVTKPMSSVAESRTRWGWWLLLGALALLALGLAWRLLR